MRRELLCLKLGGSIITNKAKPYTADITNIESIVSLLQSIKIPLVIVHGSGSFGHVSAKKYGGIHGYSSAKGIAKVAYDASHINQILMEVFIKYKMPVISFSPRSFLLASDGKLKEAFLRPIEQALDQSLIPVTFGDVIWDESWNSTIFSGEETLNIMYRFLCKKYFFTKIIELTDVNGVLDSYGNIIPLINAQNWQEVKTYFHSSKNPDVTGGMRHKVEKALEMAKSGVKTLIINGKDQSAVKKALNGGQVGTLISN